MVKGEHGEEEHGGEIERDEENIIGRTLLYLNEIQVRDSLRFRLNIEISKFWICMQ
jgi:hypothetical protein